MARSLARDEHGQSLIEAALTVPLLLLIVIGLVDVGRIFVAKTATTNAARESAALAARDPGATRDEICQRARDELGAGAGGCTASTLVITCQRGGATCQAQSDVDAIPYASGGQLFYTVGEAGADITVTVTYGINLVSGQLLGRAFDLNPVWLSSTAWFPGLGQ